MYQPRRFGGLECEWDTHFEIGAILGEACGASAWTASLVFSHIMFVARFPGEVQEGLFARAPSPIVSTGSAGGGALRLGKGGGVFSGRWGFVSGVHHADAVMVTAKVGDGAIPTHFVLLYPGEYVIEDTWNAEGLKGTGSHHIRVTDQFVPSARIIELPSLIGLDPPGSALHDSWLFRARMAPLQKTWFAGTLVGTARGALAEYIGITKHRRGQIFGETIADQAPVQVDLGESIDEVETAELLARDMCRRLDELGRTRQDAIGAHMLRLKRDGAMVARLCLSATNRLAGAVGASGQLGNHPVQRLYRDCRRVSTHVELNWHYCMAPSGKVALGLPTGDPLIDGFGAASGPQLGTQI